VNLILLFPDDYLRSKDDAADGPTGNGLVRLTGRRFEHVDSIHRAIVGDVLCVGLVGGRIGSGRVVGIDAESLEMEVVLDRDPPAPLGTTLVLALPRPLVLKRVLISATAMGAKQIYLIQANRVERSFWNSKVLRDGELDKPLILGLEQARDTLVPEVRLRTRFKPFVEDELPGLIDGGSAFVAHPDAATSAPRDAPKKTVLVIGPEGGFVPFEIERLREAGCSLISLGERILRVETVVPVLLSRFS
jgi:16S rRNA (uracil1498-N3)-methyltransferase